MFTYGRGPRASYFSSASKLDGFTDQPWMLLEGYLARLSPGATAVFQQFLDVYGECIRRAQAVTPAKL